MSLNVYVQNGAFTLEGDAMSFDECMQLLAETFPLDEPTEVIMGYVLSVPCIYVHIYYI